MGINQSCIFRHPWNGIRSHFSLNESRQGILYPLGDIFLLCYIQTWLFKDKYFLFWYFKAKTSKLVKLEMYKWFFLVEFTWMIIDNLSQLSRPLTKKEKGPKLRRQLDEGMKTSFLQALASILLASKDTSCFTLKIYLLSTQLS